MSKILWVVSVCIGRIRNFGGTILWYFNQKIENVEGIAARVPVHAVQRWHPEKQAMKQSMVASIPYPQKSHERRPFRELQQSARCFFQCAGMNINLKSLGTELKDFPQMLSWQLINTRHASWAGPLAALPPQTARVRDCQHQSLRTSPWQQIAGEKVFWLPRCLQISRGRRTRNGTITAPIRGPSRQE